MNPIYSDETCPLDGYDGTAVRVLANSSDRQWQQWRAGHLGQPDCPACAKLANPTPRGRKAARPAPAQPVYCQRCAAARAAYGQAIVTFYGPELLSHDVSTPEAALALFDSDDLLPSEIVIWLQILPGTVRSRRQETLLGNLIGSATT